MVDNSNVDKRIESFMKRKADLTKDVRFRKIRTAKWYQFLAAGKQDLL